MKRNRLVLTLFIIGILSITVGVTYSFFNYTRTGNPNTLSVGRIYFNSLQDGNINLTNIFPISSDDVSTDERNVGTFEINIEGDTTYDNGVEYLVTLSNVENTVNGKQVPLSINVSASNLGVEDQNYFTTRESKNQNIYKIMADDTVYTNNDLLVGYIKSGEEGVNGKVTIKAYFDEDKIAISDTYNGEETDEFGTTSEWVDGRVVLTTSEWNSLNSEGLSFQVKVEANEGIWVQRRNLVMKNIYEDENWVNIRENVTKVEFRTVGEVPANAITSFDVTDASSTGKVTLYTLDDGEGNGTVKAVIAGDGVIYAPEDSTNLFRNMSMLETFDSTNFKVDNVINMMSFFRQCINLKNIDSLFTWNTSHATNISIMFYECSNLKNIDSLSNWNVSNVTDVNFMFGLCINLENLDALARWNVSNVTNMRYLFFKCVKLRDIDGLSNWNTSNVIDMGYMFAGHSSVGDMIITDFSPLVNWDISKVTDMSYMFQECQNMTNVDFLSSWNTSSLENMRGMFYSCINLSNINGLSNWYNKLSNLQNMRVAFQLCTSLNDISGLLDWDVSNVTTMRSLFAGCSSITDITPLANWNVSNVTEMRQMFFGLSNLIDASAINGWDINVSSDFTQMFKSTPVHPEFTKVTGTWSSDGTFTPSA